MTAAAPAAARGLTDEQEEAVGRRRGGLLLAAGAGSGKTTVLVERFVRAVHEDGVAPSRILAITFTERAAGELRERVRRRLDELGDRAAARDTEAAFVSTIHGFCARVLRAHPLAAGLAPGFAVLDAGTAAELRDEAFATALAAWLVTEPALELAAACGVDRLAAAIMGVHDELRSRGASRPQLPAGAPRHDAARARAGLVEAAAELARELAESGSPPGARVAEALGQLERVASGAPLGELKLHRGAKALRSAMADVYESARRRCGEAEADAVGVVALELLRALLDGFSGAFAALKAARGALDYDDLELGARDLLLGDAGLHERWAERFELLMVDELQDTNPREMAILAALDRDNLFTVGDELQSIYGFRHADVSIFRRRRAELAGAGAVGVLSRNFRSRPELLRAINATFAPLFGERLVELVPGREEVEPADDEPLVELMVCDTAGWEDTTIGGAPGTGPPWRRAEAALLAGRIAELVDGGSVRPGEIAVLLRYATAATIYERALVERGVPVAPAPGGGFFATQEVAELGAYLRVLANPLDDEALYGVLASPLCGAGADALAALGLAARERRAPPWEVLADLPAIPERDRLAACRALIAGERAATPRRGLAELLVRSGYRERAAAGRGGGANVRKLLRLAREFEAVEGRDLRGFADRLASGRLGSERGQEAELGEADAVRLMTVHAAKGLEFAVVCFADLGHAPPNGGPLIVTDGERVGLRVPTLAAERLDAFAYGELRAERESAGLAEEQRIAYVAMTRARERLICSGAAHFARWPGTSATSAAIAWLGPAMVGDLADRLAGPAGVAELDLGGAALRLTLTAAEDWIAPKPRPAPRSPARRVGSPPPAQLSLFDAWVPAAPPRPSPRAAPLAVSYTSLADHARCGYGYYLRRVVGLAEVAPPPALALEPGGGAAERGRVVHALLEQLDFARPRPPTPAAVRAQSPDLGDADVAEIAGLVGAFASSPLCGRFAAAGGVTRETAFGLTLGELLVGGHIDVVAREDGEALLIVDYKTDRLEPGADLAERVARDYDSQRRIYALAGLRNGASSVEVAYCFLRRPDEPVAALYGAGDVGQLERGLAALAAPLVAGRFEVTRHPHRGICATCPGRARLCSWDEAATLGEQAAVQRD